MTPIQIRTKGQKLILVSSPPLYSGSINKNIINFILDTTWVEEKDVQAKFYRDKDIENAVETALINSSVTIPALPLEKKGKLYGVTQRIGRGKRRKRGNYMREKNSDIFEEIARNTRNISKSLYVLAYLNFMDYQQKYGIELKDNEIDHLWNLSDMLFSMKDEILK